MRFSLGRCPLPALLGLLLCLPLGSGAKLSAAELTQQTMLRRPSALVLAPEGRRLYAANHASGSVSVVDLAKAKVAAEYPVGKQLVEMIPLPGGKQLLALDDAAHELLLLDLAEGQVRVRERLPVSPYPVGIVLLADGKQCAITSLWSRRLSIVDLPQRPDERARVARVLDLDFAPRRLMLLPGGEKLLLAESAGGLLSIVDLAALKIVTRHQFPGHNVRGLGLSADGEKILVAHQMLNELAHTIRNDVHWGMLMSNDLRWLKVDAVLAGGRETYFGSHMHPLGEPGQGAGDPGGLDVAADGTVVVTLSGAGSIALGKEDEFSLHRVDVGRRPTAVKIAANGRTAYVANTFDDSISVVNLAEREVSDVISLGKQPALSLVERGELLFHDSSLSHDSWMSCASCHIDGHANGQMNDNFSDLSFGAPKRVLSLLGTSDTPPYAWNGAAAELSTQVRNSIEKTMQRDDPATDDSVKAITAYIATLALPPSVDELRGTQDPAAIERGRQVFARHDCANCHAPPTYTTPDVYDVGLKDQQGNTRFNPPSLRGISHRGPFFHDNSAARLDDVFLKHQHPRGAKYDAAEVRDLAAFLRSL